MNKFARLTPEEEATAVRAPADMQKKRVGEIVFPVPSDAPPRPTRHKTHGEPTAMWPYHDGAGRLLFVVFRFEAGDGKKEIRPCSLWRDQFGNMRWDWLAPPTPRPLYNLDKLVAKPDAVVFVCEGEKAADAAAKIFPDCVATTSPNGSQAAGKADWPVLTNRRVMIWPDADKPGADYARKVASKLTKVGCAISIIDAPALAAMAPDGLKREVEPGWDAADALAEWPDLAALREVVAAHTKLHDVFKAAPQTGEEDETGETYISCGDFTMSGNGGLTVEVIRGRGENATVEKVWVAQAFEVLGAGRDPAGKGWGNFLRWRDRDNRIHEVFVSAAELQGEPSAVCAKLADEGLRLARRAQGNLVNYLCRVNPKGRVTRVSRTGWHSIGGHEVFVLREQVLGPLGSEAVILDAAAHGPYEARGALKDWQEGIGALTAYHALAVLSISTALAGPLLHLAGQEGGGLNFFGPSSKGKTTILQAGASVWGRGGTPGYVRAWRATANGLEGAAASATDTCLVLDELGLIEARDAAAAVYGLSNGTGKARAARDGSLREPKSWRVMTLSTGEIPLGTKLAEDKGRRPRAGQAVRLLDISADRGLGHGAFDHGGATGDAAALSNSIKATAITTYGTAGPEFVRRLIAEAIDGATVRTMASDFISSEVAVGSDGQVDRAAQRLGLVAAAGEMATALGITPWREGAAREAAAWAFQRWVVGRGGSESAETRQAIEAVRLVIESHGDSRFELIGFDGDARPVNNRLGWRKGDGQEREWWVATETWKAEVCAGLDPLFVAKALAERGLLRLQGGRGFQSKVNLGDGRRVNAYVVTAGILDGGDDAC